MFPMALLYVPYQDKQRPSAEKCLVHSGVVDLAGAVVKLDFDALQLMPAQFDADGANLFWRPFRTRCFPLDDAVHQAASHQRIRKRTMIACFFPLFWNVYDK